MAKIKAIILFCTIFTWIDVFSQGDTDRYIIFLRDKLNTPYSVERPEEFLSQRAIERRNKQGISIDESDFPVNPHYISGLRNIIPDVHFKSRWFNAVLVEATETQIEEAKTLPYVLQVEYVAKGKMDTRIARRENRPKLNGNENKRTNNTSEFQNQIMGVDLMHEAGFKGEGVLIGVFDGGFINVDVLPFFAHINDNNRIKYTYDFVRNDEYVYDYDRHGAEVLSCIGAFQEGELIGTAYNADFVLCITEEVVTEYRVEEYNWAFAAEAADSVGVDIINSSLGYNTFSDATMNYVHGDLDGQTAPISIASSIAIEKGILIVSSAGNEGNKNWKKITAPADAIGAIAVGAVNNSLQVASFSSVGPTADGRIKPDVVALGSSTVVGKIDGRVGINNGTSFSSPLVAGLAAGILQANPNLTVPQLAEKLRMSGTRATSPDNSMGYGIPHFLRANDDIILSNVENSLKTFKVYPNPVSSGELFIAPATNASINGAVNIKVQGLDGRAYISKEISARENKTSSVDISHLPSGVYLIVINSRKLTETIKIVKN